MTGKPKDRALDFSKAVARPDQKKYVLRLYVAGSTSRSNQAVMQIRSICEEHLKGRYELEVIDIYQQPVLAKGEQIVATPTLVKRLPVPLRRFIGSMADKERILVGLDLREQERTLPEKKKVKT